MTFIPFDTTFRDVNLKEHNMNKNLTIFNFNENSVRTETIKGQPYFCLNDCCDALGIHNARTSAKLDKKGVGKSYVQTNGGKQKVTFINEPNLYRLIFRSNKPQAQAFADWVYSDVLPSIRKNGGYVRQRNPEIASLSKIAVDKKAMKTIGYIFKRYCSDAVREEMNKASDETTLNFISTLIDNVVDTRVKTKLKSKIEEMQKLLSV